MSSNIRLNKVCQYCSETFTAKTTVTKYCSLKCSQRAYKKRKRDEKIKKSIQEGYKIIPQHIKNEKLSEKNILNLKEVEQFVGISRSTLYRMIKKKIVTTVQIQGRQFVTRNEIRRVFSI